MPETSSYILAGLKKGPLGASSFVWNRGSLRAPGFETSVSSPHRAHKGDPFAFPSPMTWALLFLLLGLV